LRQNSFFQFGFEKTTGLFFFRGKPGAPFAVLCPGGGFRYVGSLHEGFPLAMEINKSGYNAFVLKYRVGQGETVASRDLIAAVRFIENYVKELNVAPDDYSLWGGSAGARICSNVSYGEGGMKHKGLVLCPIHAALFAAHLISFSDRGKVLVSPSVTEEEKEQFGLTKGMDARYTFSRRRMAVHRRIFNQKGRKEK